MAAAGDQVPLPPAPLALRRRGGDGDDGTAEGLRRRDGNFHPWAPTPAQTRHTAPRFCPQAEIPAPGRRTAPRSHPQVEIATAPSRKTAQFTTPKSAKPDTGRETTRQKPSNDGNRSRPGHMRLRMPSSDGKRCAVRNSPSSKQPEVATQSRAHHRKARICCFKNAAEQPELATRCRIGRTPRSSGEF